MTNELKGGGAHELSTDINVITAEINAYQRVAGEAIFEIGVRLQKARDEKLAESKGGWNAWCEGELGMSRRYANMFVKVADELGGTGKSISHVGIAALYQIATMPEETRTEPHTIPSTGAEKTVDEMTVRELREVKAELKKTQAERDAEQASRRQAERSEEIAVQRLEEVEGREPTIEIRTEYIEKEELEVEGYSRIMDEPYAVERGNDFYRMMREVDELYRKYAHLQDGVKELRGIARYDDDLALKYRKSSELWEMLSEIFDDRDGEVIDAITIN